MVDMRILDRDWLRSHDTISDGDIRLIVERALTFWECVRKFIVCICTYYKNA